MTNRGFYLALQAIGEEAAVRKVSLERYLIALLDLSAKHSAAAGLSPDQVIELLSSALNTEAPGSGLQSPASPNNNEVGGFSDWRNTIMRQIRDLREMRSGGHLADPEREFGISSPSGERWCNFDVEAYLECGAAGTVGGFEGKASVELGAFSWKQFQAFLDCGQLYE